MYVRYRKLHSDDFVGSEVREGGEWRVTLVRLYNRTEKCKPPRHISLSQHFPGGGTYHIQMGYTIGGTQETLDGLIVVQVDE